MHVTYVREESQGFNAGGTADHQIIRPGIRKSIPGLFYCHVHQKTIRNTKLTKAKHILGGL